MNTHVQPKTARAIRIFLPLLALVSILSSQATLAQTPGSLDQNFDSDGKVTVPFSTGSTGGFAIVQRPNHDIDVTGVCVSPGITQIALARILPDGSLDNSFDLDGKVLAGNQPTTAAYSSALEPGGKLVVTGNSNATGSLSDHRMMVARFNSNGSLDNTFGNNGFVNTEFTSGDRSWGWDVAIQSDGKIVAAGWSGTQTEVQFAVARYNPNGSLDSSFSIDGKVLIDFGTGTEFASAVYVQPDAKIVIAGTYIGPQNSYFAVARLNADGTLDDGFGNTGYPGKSLLGMSQQSALTEAWDVTMDTQGRILVVGFAGINATQTQPGIARLSPMGDSDDQFNMGFNGIRAHNAAGADGGGYYTIKEQVGGRYVCAGYRTSNDEEDFLLSVVKDNGTLDTDFTGDGFVSTSFGTGGECARDLVIREDIAQPMIIVAGYSRTTVDDPNTFAIARYYAVLTVGIVDFSQPANSLLVYPNPIAESTTLTYTLEGAEQLTINLVDLQGRAVLTYLNAQEMPPGEHKQEITMPSDLAAGNYMLVLSSPKGKMSIQITKH